MVLDRLVLKAITLSLRRGMLCFLLTLTALVACLSQTSCSGGSTKLITLEMKWQRSGIKQADRVSLHYQRGSVDCSLNFLQSEELEKYIENFGPAPVPVVFDVSFDQKGKATGALLIRIGKWEATKLHPNERLLSTSQKVKLDKPGETKTFEIDSPGGCFDPITPGWSARLGLSHFMLLYYLLIILVLSSWWAWWRRPVLWAEDSPVDTTPAWRRSMLTAGLISLSLSTLQSSLVVVYASVLHHHVSHFSHAFNFLVRANVVLCAFALLASLIGKGFARLPLFMATLLLLLFWGFSQIP